MPNMDPRLKFLHFSHSVKFLNKVVAGIYNMTLGLRRCNHLTETITLWHNVEHPPLQVSNRWLTVGDDGCATSRRWWSWWGCGLPSQRNRNLDTDDLDLDFALVLGLTCIPVRSWLAAHVKVDWHLISGTSCAENGPQRPFSFLGAVMMKAPLNSLCCKGHFINFRYDAIRYYQDDLNQCHTLFQLHLRV